MIAKFYFCVYSILVLVLLAELILLHSDEVSLCGFLEHCICPMFTACCKHEAMLPYQLAQMHVYCSVLCGICCVSLNVDMLVISTEMFGSKDLPIPRRPPPTAMSQWVECTEWATATVTSCCLIQPALLIQAMSLWEGDSPKTMTVLEVTLEWVMACREEAIWTTCPVLIFQLLAMFIPIPILVPCLLLTTSPILVLVQQAVVCQCHIWPIPSLEVELDTFSHLSTPCLAPLPHRNVHGWVRACHTLMIPTAHHLIKEEQTIHSTTYLEIPHTTVTFTVKEVEEDIQVSES